MCMLAISYDNGVIKRFVITILRIPLSWRPQQGDRSRHDQLLGF